MSRNEIITLIYMTPDLEKFEGGETVEEFEDLDDLIRRAKLPDLQALLFESIRYYLYYLDTHGTQNVLVARPYDDPAGSLIDDAITDDYRQADIKRLDMNIGTLDSIRERAGLETIDELLMRTLVLYEKIVCAREHGMGIGLYDQSTQEMEWLFDGPAEPSPTPSLPTPSSRKLIIH